MNKYKGLFVAQMNRGFYQDNEKEDMMRTDSLSYLSVNRGIVLPAKQADGIPWGAGGVQNPDFSFVEESKSPAIFGGNYDYNHEELQYVDDDVVYMGPFLCHWGHFICDQVSRLWYILDKVENCKVVYCGWNWGNPQTSLWGNYLEFMHLLGLKDEQLVDIQKPTQFRNVIVPELSFYRGKYYCKEYLDIFKKACSSVGKDEFEQIDKIYFTRRQFMEAQKRESGEEDIEKFFVQNGYKVIAPERLSLRQQVFYYQNAKEIAALAGSVTHSILFAGQKLNVTILNKMNLTNGYQMVIDSIVDIGITYVDVYKETYPVAFGLGPFLVGITDHLKEYAAEHRMSVPSEDKKTLNREKELHKWYIQKYHQIYSDEGNRSELESQCGVVKAIYDSRLGEHSYDESITTIPEFSYDPNMESKLTETYSAKIKKLVLNILGRRH